METGPFPTFSSQVFSEPIHFGVYFGNSKMSEGISITFIMTSMTTFVSTHAHLWLRYIKKKKKTY